MGAVKTNRKSRIEYTLTGFPILKYGTSQKVSRLDKQNYNEYKVSENWNSEINNRRKMAGLPLIRRVRS